jgi:hypothetical protein
MISNAMETVIVSYIGTALTPSTSMTFISSCTNLNNYNQSAYYNQYGMSFILARPTYKGHVWMEVLVLVCSQTRVSLVLVGTNTPKKLTPPRGGNWW